MKMLTAAELAKILNVSEKTVRLHARTGQYPFRCIRVGIKWKFPEEGVLEFVYGKNWKEFVNENDRND